MNKNLRKSITVIAISLLTVGLLEIMLRMIDTSSDGIRIGWNSVDTMKNIDSVNQLQFRGKYIKPPHEKQKIILLLGDSQVESAGLPFAYMMENLLGERISNDHQIVCYSLGSGGFGQDQELLVLKEYFNYFKADYVLLWFTPENDVWNNIFPTHWPANGTPKPTFWLQGDSLYGPNYAYREKAFSYGKNRGIKDHLKEIFSSPSQMDEAWESKLPKQTMRASKNAPNAMEQAGADENFLTEKTHYSMLSAQRSQRLQYGIDLTRKLLMEIQSVCKKNGAEFMAFSAESYKIKNMPDTLFYVKSADNYYSVDKNVYYKNIRDIMDGFVFKYFKLSTPYTPISLQDQNHFNQTAQQELADSLAVWLPLRYPNLLY